MTDTIIKNIPIENLSIHPKNIRKSYSDIEELADSIRSLGIMQNLTVTPSDQDGLYYVIIGNRRLMASLEAGLTELPCVVKEMPEQEQLLCMATENMQRKDLTPYEEGKAFEQMSLAGLSTEDIAKRTGISTKTVRSRMEIAKLDSETVNKRTQGDYEDNGKVYYQLNLTDLARLSKIDDIEARNDIVASSSTSEELSRAVERYIKDKEGAEILDHIKELLDTLKVPNKPDERSWNAGNSTLLSFDCRYGTVPEDEKIKEAVDGKNAFYTVDTFGYRVTIMTKERVKRELSETEKLEKKKTARKKEINARFRVIVEDMRQCAADIVDGVIKAPKDTDIRDKYRELLAKTYLAGVSGLGESVGIVRPYKGTKDYDEDVIAEVKEKDFSLEDIVLLQLIFTVQNAEYTRYREPFYHEETCNRIRRVLEVLALYGYKPIDGAEQMLDGTDPLYQPVVL